VKEGGETTDIQRGTQPMCNSQGAMGGAAASNNLPRLASGSVLAVDKEVQRCNGSALNLIYRIWHSFDYA
jgi:hypothetical protein